MEQITIIRGPLSAIIKLATYRLPLWEVICGVLLSAIEIYLLVSIYLFRQSSTLNELEIDVYHSA